MDRREYYKYKKTYLRVVFAVIENFFTRFKLSYIPLVIYIFVTWQ